MGLPNHTCTEKKLPKTADNEPDLIERKSWSSTINPSDPTSEPIKLSGQKTPTRGKGGLCNTNVFQSWKNKYEGIQNSNQTKPTGHKKKAPLLINPKKLFTTTPKKKRANPLYRKGRERPVFLAKPEAYSLDKKLSFLREGEYWFSTY